MSPIVAMAAKDIAVAALKGAAWSGGIQAASYGVALGINKMLKPPKDAYADPDNEVIDVRQMPQSSSFSSRS